MLKKQITEIISNALATLELKDIPVQVDYPADPKHGDYSTNAAMIAFQKIKGNGDISSPRALAERLVSILHDNNDQAKLFEKIEIAGPGFINFWIKQETLMAAGLRHTFTTKPFADKKFVVEFAHPNTHKAFHIGHLRNITTGEAIVRLLEAVGAKVVRANYQGDVGMHIAKCLYAVLHDSEFDIDSVEEDVHARVAFLGKAYAAGSKAFEESDEAKDAIKQINKQIYAKDLDIQDIYLKTRQWSLDYFNTIYKRVGSHFDRFYFESEVYESGKQNVMRGLEKGIFEKSDGAIIFPGSRYSLHDRVFVSGEGNPTYEGKEMGLGPLQFEENHPDMILHVVGPEQAGYFQVVFEALAQLDPETRGKEMHLAYGWVKLKHGKMSSRLGNVVLGESLLDEAKKRVKESYESSDEIAEQIAVGAVKYSFLKVGLGQEIAFDLDESISLQGNSGPYLQYAYARTQSVLAKSQISNPISQNLAGVSLNLEEREVLRLLARFTEIIEEAVRKYAPSTVANYLFELAQAYNLFYQKHQIIKAPEQTKTFRLALTETTGEILKQGLHLLGIDAPGKM